MLSEHISSSSANAVSSSLPIGSPASTYIIEEGVVELGAEDVVSEEIVMDDPVSYDDDQAATEVSNIVQPEVHVVLTGSSDTSQPALSHYQTVDIPVLTTFTTNVPIMSSVAYQTEVVTSNQPATPNVNSKYFAKETHNIISDSIVVDNEIPSEVVSSIAMAPDDVIIQEPIIVGNSSLDDHVVVLSSKPNNQGGSSIDEMTASWGNVTDFITKEHK